MSLLVDAAMRGVLDPGAFVRRGPDAVGEPYGEPMASWQRRALGVAFTELLEALERELCTCSLDWMQESRRHYPLCASLRVPHVLL